MRVYNIGDTVQWTNNAKEQYWFRDIVYKPFFKVLEISTSCADSGAQIVVLDVVDNGQSLTEKTLFTTEYIKPYHRKKKLKKILDGKI